MFAVTAVKALSRIEHVLTIEVHESVANRIAKQAFDSGKWASVQVSPIRYVTPTQTPRSAY